MFSRLFESVSVDATAYLMSAWRGEVNLLDLGKPEYRPFAETRRAPQASQAQSDSGRQAIEALARIGIRQAS